jgi:hypothetical protein
MPGEETLTGVERARVVTDLLAQAGGRTSEKGMNLLPFSLEFHSRPHYAYLRPDSRASNPIGGQEHLWLNYSS